MTNNGKAETARLSRLPKRFYETVEVSDTGQGWAITLDDKPVMTPGKSKLVLPSQELAQAIRREWADQKEHIDPKVMPLTKLCNTAIDMITGKEQAVIDDIAKFSASDLICYRAQEPQELVMKQSSQWDPVLDWAAVALGTRFTITKGITHVQQPEQAITRIKDTLKPHSPFSLAALHTMTTLTGSALLVLAHVAGRFDAQTCWQLCHIDEDFQISRWGQDEDAKDLRAYKWLEMQATSGFFSLVNPT